MSEIKKVDWKTIGVGETVHFNDVYYNVIGREKDENDSMSREVIYLRSKGTGMDAIATLHKNGAVDITFPEPLSVPEPGTTEYEFLYRKRPDFPEDVPHILFEGPKMWKVKMTCGHYVNDYEVYIDSEDHTLRMRYICKEGCRSEWYEIGIIPLPHHLKIVYSRPGSE